MQLNVTKTKLDGVLLIEPPTKFEDFRGEFVETYNREIYRAAGIDQDFLQDDISVSSRHVLRGLHGDAQTTKLVSCVYGKLYQVVFNNDPSSPQYRQWAAFTLSDKNRLQLLIPPHFGNGHLVLSDMAIFSYKQTATYDRPSQFTAMWNDPTINVWWPIKNPILSQRDEGVA